MGHGMRINLRARRIERGLRRVRSCWAGGRWRCVGPRARRAGEEVPLPTARAFANADPLNRRVVDQMLIGVATRQYARSLEPLAPTSPRGARASVRSVDALSRRLRRRWMRAGDAARRARPGGAAD